MDARGAKGESGESGERGEWFSRPAISDDYPHFARLFPELGVDDPLPSLERWDQDLVHRALFLEADGVPIAYGLWAILEQIGYVINVVVDPLARRRGAGMALMQAVAARLRHAGCVRWCLNVKVDNTPAIRLYERCGFARTYASIAFVFDWDCLSRLPREDTPVEVRPVDPAEDAALEAAFNQPAGRFAHLRVRPEREILRLVDPAHRDEVRVGVAAFDPSFPGASVFALARPSLAAPLLSAIRRHVPSGHTPIKLFVEDDASLDAALRAAGATVRFELLHMRGEIPRFPSPHG
jgi:GNAT superfamily N-acetyltransferase